MLGLPAHLAEGREDNMKVIKGTYKNGKITFSQNPPEAGPVEVLVVFPEVADDPWESILAEKTVRPAFAEFAKSCLKDIRKCKAKPLDLGQL
jgi:hypothetical protein